MNPVQSYLAGAVERLLPHAAVRIAKISRARVRMGIGLEPLSKQWGDRGRPMHRQYVEQFLAEYSGEIRGDCLEFQEDTYTSRFGGSHVTSVNIVHREPGNPHATMIVDLTEENQIPSALFDSIICTYVLNIVFDFGRMVAELHRLLKPNGVLLVAVPHITTCYPEHHELWRFTEEGLRMLLRKSFGDGGVTIRGYGNSLTAAGWLRGLVGRDFTKAELGYHDPRFAMVLCAKAVKRDTSA